MAQITLPLSDYTQSVKEYAPSGQKKTLWEQFLTGTQATYQGLAQQAQQAYAYDISEAYANYKQQQLQLQMNEQLGEGFRGQVTSQLQSQYGTAYENIKTQEASTLANVHQQYQSAIAAGEKEFSELGAQLKTYDKLIKEYSENLEGIEIPENMYKSTVDAEGNIITELTDYGKLWYSDVLGATYKLDDTTSTTFDEWLFSDAYTGELSEKEREDFWNAYRQNPDLFRSQVAGLSKDFNVEETRTRLAEEERAAALEPVTTILNETTKNEWSDDSLSKLSNEQLIKLSQDLQRSSDIVSHGYSKTVKNAASSPFESKKTFTDEYNTVWKVSDTGNVMSTNNDYEVGDIIKMNNKYAVIYNISSGKIYYRYATKQ